MDILNADPQKLIDDAAKQIDPPVAASNALPPPPPAPPDLLKTEEPPKLKEEAMLPEKTEIDPVPPVIPTPAPDIPTPPPMPPAEPLQSITFGAPAPKEPEPPLPSSPPSKKGGARKGVILAGLLLLLITLPVAVFYISQQQKQLTETRSKAAGASCGWCAAQPQCPHAPESGGNVAVCGGNLPCCQGYNAGGSAPAPGGGGGGGGSTNPTPINGESCGWCAGNDQCFSSTGHAATKVVNAAVCSTGYCCTGYTPPTSGTGSTTGGGTAGGTACTPGQVYCRKDNIAGTACPNKNSPTAWRNSLVGARCNSSGTAIDPATCDYFDACAVTTSVGGSCNGLTNIRNLSTGSFVGCSGNQNCFCGNGTAIQGFVFGPNDGNVKCISNVGGTSCGMSGQPSVSAPAPTAAPSGCKSDWCTSASDCASKGGTVGTPASFASCSPGLVACCVSLTQVTTPPPPAPGQCTRIKVYKGTVAVVPTTLVPGDNVTLAVAGTNATRGRIRVNGAAFVESTTLNANGEYTVPFTVPAGVPSFTIEAEVLTNGQWQ